MQSGVTGGEKEKDDTHPGWRTEGARKPRGGDARSTTRPGGPKSLGVGGSQSAELGVT